MRRALVGVAAIYTAAHFYFAGVKQPFANFYGDFLASFPSWRLSVLLGRLDLYKGSLAEYWAMRFGGTHPLWHYGPVEHLVTLPLFAFGDLRTAYTAWLIANYVFLIAIIVLATTIFEHGALAVLAVLNYGPLFEALTQRTIEIFELLLLFVAFALRRRKIASGIAMGFAAMTKFLPLIFVPYFALKRRVATVLITIGLIAIATQLVFDWRYSGTVVQLRNGGMIASVLDQSLAGMMRRLGASETLARIAIVIALAGLSWLFYRARNSSSIDDLAWSTLIVAMVLLPPHNEQYYFVLLLFPYLALAARELRRSEKWWLGISFVLTGTLIPLSIVSRLAGTNVFSAYLALGIPFVGAAILAALCVSGMSYAVLRAEQQCPSKTHSPI
ncbi:MAG TPA: glycosyltransferase family 87 protein [Thermoanaerobaculia bacterium]|jgi:hypothetical protein|nr:glycosyltransferase family 87 protein [Thermoanaerobaculia bacterium]